MAVGAPEQLPASARAAPEPDPEDASPTGELLDELERLQDEYSELKSAAAERDAGDGVALHDAQLLRLK
eukprot:CAMPEP_0179304868 /NCGR_PEP_ID=MMETSP0797-20121207/49326_1 /TAXON_ID=47934 /ORGANISM="Dinophysis acuminata, Strain DAEP01" /LENGTH=68 /DNA_ID=CAMNT_0021014491 /DNA_START=16 /DNA_END=219 /DNA_ORIENTATION=-